MAGGAGPRGRRRGAVGGSRASCARAGDGSPRSRPATRTRSPARPAEPLTLALGPGAAAARTRRDRRARGRGRRRRAARSSRRARHRARARAGPSRHAVPARATGTRAVRRVVPHGAARRARAVRAAATAASASPTRSSRARPPCSRRSTRRDGEGGWHLIPTGVELADERSQPLVPLRAIVETTTGNRSSVRAVARALAPLRAEVVLVSTRARPRPLAGTRSARAVHPARARSCCCAAPRSSSRRATARRVSRSRRSLPASRSPRPTTRRRAR